MEKLPKWLVTDTHPSLYDLESATAIEQTAKVYGAMQKLIEEYNAFSERVNAIVEEYEGFTTKDNEEFRVALRQEFQDFIDIINLKVKAQDKEIDERFKAIVEDIETRMIEFDDYLKNSVASMNEELRAKIEEQNEAIENAVNYMKDNITQTVTTIIESMVDSGEIADAILEGFEGMKTQLDEAVTKIEAFESEIQALRETIEEVVTNYETLKSEQDAIKERLDNELNFENVATGTEITLNDHANAPIIELSARLKSDSDLEIVEMKKIVARGRNMVNFKNAPEFVQGTIGNVVYAKQENGSFTRTGSGKICQDAYIFGDGTVEGKPNDLNIVFKAGHTYYLDDCVLYTYDGSRILPHTGTSDEHYVHTFTPSVDEILIAVRFPNTGNGTSYDDMLYPIIAESDSAIPWEEYDGKEIEIGQVNIYDSVLGVMKHIKASLDSECVFEKVGDKYGLNDSEGFLEFPCTKEIMELTPFENGCTIYAVGVISGTDAETISDIELSVKYYNNSKNGKRFAEFHKCAIECKYKE